MTHKINLVLLLLVAFSLQSFSQNQDIKDQIAEKLNSYFALERENIHLHLNKDIYLSDEDIWFKGYTYNRKELLPFYKTMNVFVVLYDQTGTKINQQLAYANTGSFEGAFKNLEQLPSGNYYIQVYTNWMNNFQENESSIYPIKIINSEQPDFFDTTLSNLATAKIEIHPEGGTLVYGITNSVGVKISDKFNNPIGNVVVELRDHANTLISEIPINKGGFGKFMVTPKNDRYSLLLKTSHKTIEQHLPTPAIKGLSLEVNSYALPNKASVKIKTNEITYTDLKSKKLFLVVHQDARALVFDVAIDPQSLEQTLLFSTDNISFGVNTIRIVDENMNQLAERTFIKLPISSQKFMLSKIDDEHGYMKINGKSKVSDANLSVSVLPFNSKAANKSNSIRAAFLCNSYLIEPVKNFETYTKEATLATKYELDLALLNQSKSKYAWKQISTTPPTAKFEFDLGLTVKGTLLNPALKDMDGYNVRLRSYHHQIVVQSPISSARVFEFNHLVLSDSTVVDFGLFKNTDPNPIKMSHNARIINGNRDYTFAFKGFTKEDLNQPSNSLNEELPDFFAGMVKLKAVEVEAKKITLTRGNQIENRNLRGFKVPPSMTIGVLTYIETNGFNVRDDGVQVFITARSTTSIKGGPAIPIIYLDNVQLRDFNFLQNFPMEDLDEIYLNPHTIIPSIRNYQGIIRMYRKVSNYGPTKTNLKNSPMYNGFATAPKFENANYTATSTQGFTEFGVINWVPFILTDEKNGFQFDVPNYNQKKVKVITEGFSFDGELISEIQIIDL